MIDRKNTEALFDCTWFSGLTRPSRYLGNEVNAVKKEPSSTEVSFALAFPDLYEVGMSHFGLKILYEILNAQPWLAAERVFSPGMDLERELRRREIPLCSLESGRPLGDFDLLGFSLQHDLGYTNVLNILSLSGIPFLSRDRTTPFPLVIAGGPACFNPEPVADLFDAMVIGDGEETALRICEVVREAKACARLEKRELLERLAGIEGVYIPSFFKVRYTSEGLIEAVEPVLKGYDCVRKAVLPDIDTVPFPTKQVVPFSELIHDRLAIEIARGCTRGCRFCQAGMIYRPVRERHPLSVIKAVESALTQTGYDEVSFLSLSTGDYGCIGPLLKSFMDLHSADKVAFSFPSLRVDSLDPLWLEQIKRVRKTGFTLAPEVGNDRLRRSINKALTNEQILKTAREVYGAGWNLLKLYFMVGLPGEGDSDLRDIVSLAHEVAGVSGGKGRRAKLHVSLATFIPKPHTPFMWDPQISLEESKRRIRLIRNGLKGPRIRVKQNDPEMSRLEGIFSRGDRRLTPVLIEAFRRGARFDAWSEYFNPELWEDVFKEVGLDPAFYLERPRSTGELMPWDHIRSGVAKEFFLRERKRAEEGKTTPDCRVKCLECGVCDHKRIDPVLFKSWDTPVQVNSSEPLPYVPARKFRLTYCKLHEGRLLGHLELTRLFIRALKRADLKLVHSKGFHPMPKIAFLTALPLGTESLEETVDIEICNGIPIPELKRKIQDQLPAGIRLLLVRDVTQEKSRPVLKESHFIVRSERRPFSKPPIESFLRVDRFPVVKKDKQGERTLNARPLVASMRLVSPRELELVMRYPEGPKLKPIEIVKSVFQMEDQAVQDVRILKSRQIMA